MTIPAAGVPIKRISLPRLYAHQHVHPISKPSANIINQHRPSSKCSPLLAVGDGGDNSGGNGGRKWVDSSNNNEDDNNDKNQSRFLNIGFIMTIITLSLLYYASHLGHQHTASSSTQQDDTDKEDPSLVFDTDDIQSIKRLLREAFSEFVKLRRRISTLEDIAEVDPLEDEDEDEDDKDQYQEDDAGDNSSSSSGTPLPYHHHSQHGKKGGKNSNKLGRRKSLFSSQQHQGSTVLHGTVDYGTALSWPFPSPFTEEEEDIEALSSSSPSSPSSVPTIKQGAVMKFHTTASIRNSFDDITFVCTTSGNDNFILEKIMYLCRLTSQLRAVVVPIGGSGQDIAYTLNPVAGQGLTAMVRHGSPLHQEPLGAVAGVAVDLDKAWFSGGVFSNKIGNNNGGQFPLLRALHNNSREEEKGVLVQGAVALSHDVSLGAILKQKISSSSTDREMGLMGAIRIGAAAALHSWTHLRLGDNGSKSSNRGVDGWGCCVAAYPDSNNNDGGGNGWTVGAGKINHKRGGGGGVLVPNMYEVSMKVDMGDGVTLTPGMVVVVGEGGRREVMAGVRSTVSF